MRITERKLRRLIRSIINEASNVRYYDDDDPVSIGREYYLSLTQEERDEIIAQAEKDEANFGRRGRRYESTDDPRFWAGWKAQLEVNKKWNEEKAREAKERAEQAKYMSPEDYARR